MCLTLESISTVATVGLASTKLVHVPVITTEK